MRRRTAFFSALLGIAAADCSRELLQGIANSYLDTVTADGSSIDQANDFVYTENFRPTDIKTGVLSKAINISHNRTLLDSTECALYVEIIAPNNKPQYVTGAQIYANADGKVTKVDTVINSDDPKWISWFPNAPLTLQFTLEEEKENAYEAMAEEDRPTREQLRAAADAYFELFRNMDPSSVPFAPDCTRIEGGLPLRIPCQIGMPSGDDPTGGLGNLLGGGSSLLGGLAGGIGNLFGGGVSNLASSLSSMSAMTNRRYVIDEVVGSIDVMLMFGGAAPDSHEFRLDKKGQIKYVHAISVMDIPSMLGALSPAAGT